MDAFLRTILADPTDNTTRLVYADWLEEQCDQICDAKSEYLRLTVALTNVREREGAQLPQCKRLSGARGQN